MRRCSRASSGRYGVDRYVVAAIWGIESHYGAVLSNPKLVKNTIRSLATLAWSGGRLAKYGRKQLVAALKIVQRGDIGATAINGSWAGAMGQTQFIPTTFEAFAVDYDGDGHRNIWTSVPDALASTANYLKKSGWEAGRTWGYEVKLPAGFNTKKTERAVAGGMDEARRQPHRRRRLSPPRRHGAACGCPTAPTGRRSCCSATSR